VDPKPAARLEPENSWGSTPLEAINKEDLAARIREVREEMYGEHGAQFMADALGVALRTWMNYERGVAMPAKTILRLITTTNVNPSWLLTGRGEKYDR
jgi:transcriptional regulator with XRE-family HTH domain